MRLLHTSDWHLGALFHDQDREADELHALAQLVAIARDEEVDVVLVAGDVFDTANPSADAQRRYYEVLRQLIVDGGVGTIVVIGGNHDNGLRLDGPRELLAGFRVHVRGQLGRQEAEGACLVELVDRNREQVAVCAAVPYLREADVRAPKRDESAREIYELQAEAMHERFAAIRQAAIAKAAGRPVVVMAHCFASGAAPSEDERPVYAEQVGKLSQVKLGALADGAAYAALGHLHKPQELGGQEHVRYSGSLLPNGFDQTATARSVVIADVPSEGPASVRLVPLAPYRRYARVEGTREEIEAAIAALPAGDDGAPEAWLQVTVKLDGPRPGIAAEVGAWASARGYRALSIRPMRSASAASTWTSADEISGIDTLDPVDVFRKLRGRDTADGETPPDDDLVDAFRALLHRVQGEAAS